MLVRALGWMASVALCLSLLLRARHTKQPLLIVRRAALAMVGAVVLLIAIDLAVAALGVHPSREIRTYLIMIFITAEIVSGLNIGNVVFHGMAVSLIAFHQKYNSARLHRFPISFLIKRRDHLKILGTIMWCLGSILMLYGVWFDTEI